MEGDINMGDKKIGCLLKGLIGVSLLFVTFLVPAFIYYTYINPAWEYYFNFYEVQYVGNTRYVVSVPGYKVKITAVLRNGKTEEVECSRHSDTASVPMKTKEIRYQYKDMYFVDENIKNSESSIYFEPKVIPKGIFKTYKIYDDQIVSLGVTTTE